MLEYGLKDDVKGIFDNLRNVKLLKYFFYVLCLFVVIVDFFIEFYFYFDIEKFFVFYGLYGGIMCVVLVIVVKWMWIIVMWDEDYYDC